MCTRRWIRAGRRAKFNGTCKGGAKASARVSARSARRQSGLGPSDFMRGLQSRALAALRAVVRKRRTYRLNTGAASWQYLQPALAFFSATFEI